MSFAGGNGSTMILEKQKLNNLGCINPFLGFQNDPNHLRRITNKPELAQSLPPIYYAEVKESAVHKTAHESETQLLAPAAKNKLITRGTDVKKLTKKEIISVLTVYYGKKETDKIIIPSWLRF